MKNWRHDFLVVCYTLLAEFALIIILNYFQKEVGEVSVRMRDGTFKSFPQQKVKGKKQLEFTTTFVIIKDENEIKTYIPVNLIQEVIEKPK